MAFKKVTEYNEERFGNFFLLRNDGDYADVVFLYEKMDDVLEASVHYIKSDDYTGYVHCNGARNGCPACAKNIRVQNKLFIPLYLVNEDRIVFWDRTMQFENQLNLDVFSKYPNPSEFVFRIQRKGVARDVNTTYTIMAMGRNNIMSYNEILTKHNVSMPDAYSAVCKELTNGEMEMHLNSASAPAGSSAQSTPAASMPSYVPIPRPSATPAAAPAPAVPDIVNDDDDEEPVDF